MDFRDYIRTSVSKDQHGIEIGASFAPILPKSEGYKTLVVDHADAPYLVAKYTALGVNCDKIETVDAIDNGGEFTELNGTAGGYDFIVASHVLEHLPDPIHFLQRCARALKKDGRLFLLVPDRRFCFDYLRPTSTAGQFLQAYLLGPTRHNVAALFDHHAYCCTRNGTHVWADSDRADMRFAGTAAAGYSLAAKPANEYVDCHSWVFTPSSFRLIIEDLRSLGMVPLGEVKYHPSVGCEFLVVLSPIAASVGQNREILAIQAVDEALPSPAEKSPQASPVEVDDVYVHTPPSAQNAVDLFKGSWIGAFPADMGLKAGDIWLCHDPRLAWAIDKAGGVAGIDVLELGPLEASHTAMLLEAGACSVLAIEANKRAFLRCLITKEVRNLQRASFTLGDFVPFLSADSREWPFIVACGVLYHMTDPLNFLELLARRTNKLFIWTHVIDNQAMPSSDVRRKMIVRVNEQEWHGRNVKLHVRPYGSRTDPTFCGGPVQGPNWLERQDLMMILEALGFDRLQVAHEAPDHPAGPALSIFAERTRPKEKV